MINWGKFISDFKVDSVDLLTLDVEGHELSVIDGIRKTKIYPNVIQVEFLRSDPERPLLNEETKQDFSGFITISKILKRI